MRLWIVLLSAALITACERIPRREILFQARAPGDPETILALAPRSGDIRRVTEGDSSEVHSVPAWSPDGRRIAFVRELRDHDELHLIDSAGGPARRIALEAPRSIAFPDWSPDGSRLLFSAGATIDKLDVYVVSADGRGLRQVLADSANYRCPSWAPDGGRFIVAESTPFSSRLVEVDIATGIRTTRIWSDSTNLDCPQWSPDGAHILMSVFHGGVDPLVLPPEELAADLQVLSLADGTVQRITHGPGLNNYGRWSRNSRWIVFQSDRHAVEATDSLSPQQRFDNLELYLIRVDGKRLRRLTENAHPDLHPAW